ncbi:hypothetical protein Bcsk_004760 [Bartonella sp. CDC_skunk]|uniref:hypothetical protein n=1 Tax=unclassified Bartonella TaxID=2645622 RepID=UPI0009997171|nr:MULTISPECIES: hypothetical protein [unclassified Bartonella]AQX21134.1 hypothetical protein Bcsk_004760 [Bartonella sp. CDC_skunk]AQX26394.1 hypothetical protein Bra60_003740 [Bartonella sp. Raccoon60]
MKIKGKIFLSLIITILMIKPSISGPYVQPGYIGSVGVDLQTFNCTLKVIYKSSPDIQLGTWRCDSTPGKAILDLAKIATILDRPVEVVFMSSKDEAKPVLGITLK